MQRRRDVNHEHEHGNSEPDVGNLDPRLMPLSRNLARILRHAAKDFGLKIDTSGPDGGWCKLHDLFAQTQIGWTGFTEDDVREVVRESFSGTRPRFEINETAGCLWIRATHKHSITGLKSETPAQAAPAAPLPRRGVDGSKPMATGNTPLKATENQPGSASSTSALTGCKDDVGPALKALESAICKAKSAPSLPSSMTEGPQLPALSGSRTADPWMDGADPWATSKPSGGVGDVATPTRNGHKGPECRSIPGMSASQSGGRQAEERGAPKVNFALPVEVASCGPEATSFDASKTEIQTDAKGEATSQHVEPADVEIQEPAEAMVWQKYAVETGSNAFWWWCESLGQGFVESRPESWTRYAAPDSKLTYWWKDDDTWFWEHTGSTKP